MSAVDVGFVVSIGRRFSIWGYTTRNRLLDTTIQITQLRVRFYWFSDLRGSERGRKYGIFADLPISKEAKISVFPA